MATFLESIIFDTLASDPGSPAEGQAWYNSTSNQLKMFEGGANRILADTRHTGDTNNPHTTTLDQARSAGNTLAGNIDANDVATIVNLPDPTNPGDASSKNYVDNKVKSTQQGIDWQNSVLDKDLNTPPGTPSDGDRYIVAATATGDWAGKEKQIAEWDADETEWVFTVPNEGFACRVEDENKQYIYDGSAWGLWDATVDHTALQNIGSNSHSAIDSHIGSTANPHSVTAAQVGNGTAQWNADKLQGSAVSASSPSTNDHLVWNGTSWTPTSPAASSNQKSGSVLAASFAGSPKSAAVVFGTAYADNNYSVALTQVASAGNGRVLSVSAKSASGFTIELNTGSVVNLTSVEWITVPHYNP